jgi:phosphoribosylpyrophosphate synthetase
MYFLKKNYDSSRKHKTHIADISRYDLHKQQNQSFIKIKISNSVEADKTFWHRIDTKYSNAENNFAT